MAHLKEQVADDENPDRDHDKAQKGQVAADQVKMQPKKSRAAKRYDAKKDAK